MDFALPPVGEGLFEVELVRWLVEPGESVQHGQALAELMSDKATMELPSPFDGKITALHAEPGTKIKVGQKVLQFESVTGERSNGETTPVEAKSERRDSRPTDHAPEKAERTSEAKPSAARNGGMEPRRSSSAIAVLEAPAAVKQPVAAPSVRHMARKLGVDLTRVRGSGPAGRILLDDLTSHIASKSRSTATEPMQRTAVDMTHGLELGKAGTRVKLAGLRRKIAEKMVTSVRTIPHYSYIDECEITDLVKLRTQLKETLAAAGVKLTYLPFFVKAVARALKDVPAVNATFNEESEEVTLHEHYHIGIAVAAPNGLIVPVIKDADKKDVAAIATEIDRLSKDARAGRPKLDDLKGGTFTITNIGNIGGLISTPIINHPEIGIMGIGKVIRRPVYDSHGDLRPADLIYLSFSFDHRVLDGAVGAVFGNHVIKYMQNPATLLLPERFSP